MRHSLLCNPSRSTHKSDHPQCRPSETRTSCLSTTIRIALRALALSFIHHPRIIIPAAILGPLNRCRCCYLHQLVRKRKRMSRALLRHAIVTHVCVFGKRLVPLALASHALLSSCFRSAMQRCRCLNRPMQLVWKVSKHPVFSSLGCALGTVRVSMPDYVRFLCLCLCVKLYLVEAPCS